MAKRAFADCVNSKDHQFGKNPHDYTLFVLGDFDDATAKFTCLDHAESLGNGVEYVTPAAPSPQGDLLEHLPDTKVSTLNKRAS